MIKKTLLSPLRLLFPLTQTFLRTTVAPRRGVQTGNGGSGDQRTTVQISNVAWFGALTVTRVRIREPRADGEWQVRR
jgi:hypothetical protein